MSGVQKIRMINKGEDVLSKPLRRKAGSGDRAVNNTNPSMMDYVPQQPKVNQLIGPNKSVSGSFIGTGKTALAAHNKHNPNKGSQGNLNEITGILLNNMKPSGMTQIADGVVRR